jgi:hypothetical protein
MQIDINSAVLVAEVQGLFSEAYPYLKIEFFEAVANVPGVRRRSGVPPETNLGKIRTKEVNGILEIDDSTTVTELEQVLTDRFGLESQVYRRAGNIWIETNITDMWTLEHQNEQGRQLSLNGGMGLRENHKSR